MTDLRKAAEMALNAMLDIPMAERPKAQVQAIQALRQALAQPECVDAVNMSQERVDETAKREHEPYGYVWTSLRDGMEVRFSRMPPNKFYNPQDIKPVYTAPPKREWVGLTEYQRLKFANRFHISEVAIEAIEAKLKEKNS